MTTELTIVEQIPALAKLDVSPELLEQFTDLFYEITEVPDGIDPNDWEWEAETVKINTPTTSDTKVPGDAAIGDIWTPTGVLWSMDDDGPKNPFKFIPVFYWKTHKKWKVNDNGLDCQSDNGITSRTGLTCADCVHLPWKGSAKIRPGNAKTACSDSLVFLVIAADLSGIYQLELGGTSIWGGKDIIKGSRRGLSKRVWGLAAEKKEGHGNKWIKYTVTGLGDPVDPAVAAFCAEIAKHKKQWHTDLIAEQTRALRAADEILDAAVAGDGNIDALEAELMDADDGFSESM